MSKRRIRRATPATQRNLRRTTLEISSSGWRGVARSLCERLNDIDRFARVHYFAFTAMLILLGVAASGVHPDPWRVAGLLLVGACFHVHGYVLNDVIDLDLDRTQARRARDPLVRGAVSRAAASALAWLQLPLAALAAWWLRVGARAAAVLSAGFALAYVYNRWGKRCPVPPLTDFVQGLSWAMLAVFAALAIEPGALRDAWGGRLAPIAVHGAGFIFLINGIHGGLRDLVTDLAGCRRTTSIFLGARPDPRGPAPAALSSPGVIAFAFGVHAAMFAPSFHFLWRHADLYAPGWRTATAALVTGLFAASSAALWRVVRPREPERGWWVSASLFVLILPPLALYLPSQLVTQGFAALVLGAVVVPLALQVGVLERIERAVRP